MAGGGPAGSACAIAAARAGARVLLLEKDRLPRHKVCGEFVSSESLRLLVSLLGGDPFASHPQITSSRLFLDGRTVALPVTPAARSISRFELDAALLSAARNTGVEAREGVTILAIDQSALRDSGGCFMVRTAGEPVSARAVVNATGRWSQLTRPKPSAGETRWIGLKAHFREASPPDSVDLYFFTGGYCGVQKVGDNTVNAAAMVQAGAARSLEEVLAAHPELDRRSRGWEIVSPAVTTSQLYFRAPQTSDGQMLQAGDSAAFIDPFAGDGISLALHSGALAAEILIPFFDRRCSLDEAKQRYHRAYFARFAPAFRNAARLRSLLGTPGWVRSRLLRLIGTRPIANRIVRGTRARAS